MANQLDNFDKLIKESFDGFEVPFDSEHWEELQANLDATSPSLPSYFGAITTGLAATGIVFLSMLFFFSDYQYKNKEVAHVEEIQLNGANNSEQGENTTTANSESTAELNKAASVKDNLSEDSVVENTELAEASPTAKTKTDNKKSTKSNNSNNNSIKESAAIIPVKTVKSKPGTENVANVRTGCTGLVINFDASEEYGSDAKYLWNFGDGFFSNEPKPSHTFNKEGIFDVSLSVTSKTTGQISSNVVQAMIEVKEAPVANFKVEINDINSIVIKNDSFNANDLSWDLNNQTVLNKNEVTVSVADNTRQNLTLSVGNDGGCTDTLETIINSIGSGSEFPRALDLSFGVNFAPGAILDNGSVESVKIFEKSTGKLVFEGEGNKGWNGTDMSGNPAAKGSYKWLMAVKKSGSFDIYKGDIELR